MAPSSTNKEAITFRPSTPDDAGGIRQLLRGTPFGHRISLTLEPDPGHSPLPGDPGRDHTIVATRDSDPHTILGLAERTGHRVWINRQPVRLGYLGQLRRQPGEDITLRRLREGYTMLEARRRDDELPFDYTSILADNTPARRLLERGLPGLPRYQPAGTMTTLTLSTNRARALPAPVDVRPLTPGHHDNAIECLHRHHCQRQLAPHVDATIFSLPGIEWFHTSRNDHTTGCLALWNQSAFKTIAVQGYAPWIHRFRQPINLLRSLQGTPTLPPPGHRLPLAFLAFLAADDNAPDTIVSLITAAAQTADQQHLTHLCLGLPADHPALPFLRKRLRPETTDSIIYLVHPANRPATTPLDTAHPIHPEIALL